MAILAMSVLVSCGDSANDDIDTSDTTALIEETQFSDPATDALNIFFRDMYNNFNSKEYDKYLSNYDYDDSQKEELKAGYIAMESFSVSTYDFENAVVLHRTEDNNLMVEVNYKMTTVLVGSTDQKVSEEKVYYQIKTDGDSYKIISVSPGSSTDID